MKPLNTLICSFGLLFTTPLLHAGSAPESTSLVNGYFLGYPEYAYISIAHSSQYMNELYSVCKTRGRLWALGVDAKFECKGIRRIEEGGDGPVYELEIKGNKKIKVVSHALLYSTRPFAPTEWAIRALSTDEARELQVVPGLRLKKYRKAIGNIHKGRTVVVEPTNGKLKIFIVPWRTADDGVVQDQEFIIAVRLKSGVISLREARGTIIGYADLNGDGIPELQNSMNCDGRCESMMSVSEKSGEVVYIYSH